MSKDPLKDLYDSEINWSLSTFWDGGIDVKLGDELNGFKDEANFDTIGECVDWLVEAACAYYPLSTFAKKYKP